MDNETIDSLDLRYKCGNYALGFIKNNIFIVLYVGRSDDLARRLKEHIGEKSQYINFKFSFASSILEAYKKECKNYHDFGGGKGLLFNEIHPSVPEGYSIECPYCIVEKYLEAYKKASKK